MIQTLLLLLRMCNQCMPRIYIQKCDVLVSLLYSEVFIFIAPLYPEYLLCSPSTWAGRTSTNPCFTSTMDHYS